MRWLFRYADLFPPPGVVTWAPARVLPQPLFITLEGLSQPLATAHGNRKGSQTNGCETEPKKLAPQMSVHRKTDAFAHVFVRLIANPEGGGEND